MTYAQLNRQPRDEAALRAQECDAGIQRPEDGNVVGIHKQTITPASGDEKPDLTDSITPEMADECHTAGVDLATRIRTGRRRAHFSQTALAQRLGVRQSAISQWESGRSQPDLDNRIRLADVLKIPLPELLPESGPVPATVVADPIVLRAAETFAQLPPEWQTTVQSLIYRLLEDLRKPR